MHYSFHSQLIWKNEVNKIESTVSTEMLSHIDGTTNRHMPAHMHNTLVLHAVDLPI